MVIGAQRSGTTYLYRVLDEHPDIVMARPVYPEPKFFLDPDNFAKGHEWYHATYFADTDGVAVRGEKSTSYMESADAAKRVATMLPEAQILVLLRNPVDRAVSNWKFSTASGMETRPLDEALEQNLGGPRDWDPAVTSVSPFAYLERGRYMQQLRPWIELFAHRVHVLFTEEFVGDANAVTALYRRLEVDHTYRPPSLDERVNASSKASPGLPARLTEALRDWFADSDRELRDWVRRPLPWDRAAAVRL